MAAKVILYDKRKSRLGQSGAIFLIIRKGRIMLKILLFKAFRAAVKRQVPDGRAARIVVQVTGEVDVATSALLAAAVKRAIEMKTEDRVDLVMDLAQVRFIDASGINVLLNVARQVRAGEGTLVLRSPSRAVRRLLDVLHLDEVLAVECPVTARLPLPRWRGRGFRSQHVRQLSHTADHATTLISQGPEPARYGA